MLTLITSLFSDFLPYIAGAVALLASFWGYGASKKKQGRRQAENEADKDSLERQKRGKDAVSDLIDADRDELINVVRKNHTGW